MPISSKNIIVQAKITKNVFTLVSRYCKLAGLSVSQYCANAISHQVYSDFVHLSNSIPTTFEQVDLDILNKKEVTS